VSGPYKPLVVGAPRSGFALLASVVIHFVPFAPSKLDRRQRVLNAMMREMGQILADNIVALFARQGIERDLLYNPNFRYLVGGPKWLLADQTEHAAFRKYIGVRDLGDFTLVTSHPRQILDMDEIVHSHTAPSLWPEHPGYADYTRFASSRNPVGILNSSIFSINALASEYIQKFVPPELDNDDIRQQLALYKYTDLRFFEGLFSFLATYLDEFLAARERYILMRWEDLILTPEATINRLADEAGIALPVGYARSIWAKLDHVNLTQAHKHNYRVGKGIVGDWKNWITNDHLAILKEQGFDDYCDALGYGKIEFLDESAYTPFQKRVSEHLRRGEVYMDFPDMDLFEFAFNKSNFNSEHFPFRRHPWREHTQIERSGFKDAALEQQVSDLAEEITGEINAVINDVLGREWSSAKECRRHLEDLRSHHAGRLGAFGPAPFEAGLAAGAQVAAEASR